MSGGIDPAAFHRPKRFFGSARNVEEGGSLTILATALVDTGSRMDDVIYEEFKGTGNLELHLDRRLSERRIFPRSTSAAPAPEERNFFLSKSEQEKLWTLRKTMSEGLEYTDSFLRKLAETETNEEFLSKLESRPRSSTA